MNFKLSGDNPRNLVLLDGLDDVLDELLLSVIELAGLVHENAGLIHSIRLGKLFTQGENLFVQVDEETLDGDSEPTFGASLHLLTLYHIFLQDCEAVDLVSQFCLDSIEHCEGILRVRILVQLELSGGRGVRFDWVAFLLHFLEGGLRMVRSIAQG